jgi:NADH:ubiquinone oxidoreductase subunit 3 (subunit A)
MLIEMAIAFILILIATLAIYSIGRRSAPKTVESENAQSPYGCGEKVSFPGLKINVSLYKYLIYFVIFDAAILVLAFATFAMAAINPYMIILYLGIMLAAGVILMEGGKE